MDSPFQSPEPILPICLFGFWEILGKKGKILNFLGRQLGESLVSSLIEFEFVMPKQGIREVPSKHFLLTRPHVQ